MGLALSHSVARSEVKRPLGPNSDTCTSHKLIQHARHSDLFPKLEHKLCPRREMTGSPASLSHSCPGHGPEQFQVPDPSLLEQLYSLHIPALHGCLAPGKRRVKHGYILTTGAFPPFAGVSASTSRRSWGLLSDGYRGWPQPGSPGCKLRLWRLGYLQLNKDNDNCHSVATCSEAPFLPPIL